ncbi:MAG TPA: hypothetical protein VLN44_06760 [Pyrinomonadaceae bacterium]|nr:hypothetical protein [Pyrinomonadaceae bacterium]
MLKKIAVRVTCLILTVVCLCWPIGTQTQEGTTAASGRPKLTPTQWREDLQFAVDTFLARDRSFSPAARQEFRAAIAKLQQTVESKTDEQIIVELAKAVALAKNAHTRLYLVRNRTELRRFPIRVWWFADGLYVVRTAPELSALLGARVLRIAGRDVREVRREVAPLYAGNDAWREYISAYTITSPDVLMGLGLTPESGRTQIVFIDRQGHKARRALEPLPLRRSDQPTESWWDLCPTRPRDDGEWVSALELPFERLPLYVQNTERSYWSRYLPADRILYLQFNRSGNAASGESLAEFGRRTVAEIQTMAVNKIVVDVRFNTGGDLSIGRPFINQLGAFAKEHRIKVYVITGRATFSAGIYHAMQLRQFANAVLVGEPFGDGLDFWSEGGNLLTPNSRLSLHFADRLHSYSPIVRPEFDQYLIKDTDLSITNPGPDIVVKMTARDYFAGRDPALAWVKRAKVK